MTPQQTKAAHLYFRWIAAALCEIGFDMREIKIPIRPTEENVKELCKEVVRNFDGAAVSSTQWKTKHIDFLVDAMSRGLAEHEIYVPFPSEIDLKKKDTSRIF